MKHLFLFFLIVLSLSSCKKNRYALHVVTQDTLVLSPMEVPQSLLFDSIILTGESKDVKIFYKNNSFKTVWVQEQNRNDLIQSISDLASDGISPNHYALDSLKNYQQHYAQLTDLEKTKADLLFTQTFFKMASHLYNGVLNPKELYNDWELPTKPIHLPATLHLTLQHNAVPIAFDSIRPRHPIYGQLKEALSSLKSKPDAPETPFKTDHKIKLNDRFPEVITLKEKLIYWEDLAPLDSMTPLFDDTTVAALKHFQLRNGLDETGLLDSKTIEALNKTKLDQMQKIVVNLERWRWFPRNLGAHYVLINLPAYRLVAITDGDTIQKHKVIVGTPARKTPILSSEFSGLVINPTWTVPPTILKQDLVPAASKNRGYFASRGFTIYDSKGAVVTPEEWDPQQASRYRYVQKPGDTNSLGRIKFDFKNNHMVYLHDTNNKNNFNKEDRGLSSGCVRVEDPFELADYILLTENSSYTLKQINTWLQTEKTQHIPLQKKVQIHQLYWTAWKDTKGIQFRNDIYKLDAPLYEKLISN